nr:flagellar biosynthesis protein FlhB [uncultured Desulfobacter sp.]
MAEDPEGGGEKTENASGRKLGKARDEGQVAKSQEIPSVFIVLAGITALYATAPFFYQNCVEVFRHNFMFERALELNRSDLTNMLIYHAKKIFLMCLPVFAVVCFISVVSNIAQVGFHISWKVLEPKFTKLNPINGFKSKFSSSSTIEFLKSLAKLTVISIVCYLATRGDISKMLTLYDNSIAQILLFLFVKSFWIFIKVCIIMILVAILDYAFQKWKFLEDQKMTKQEVKDERKQTEGDPAVKSRIRQLQMAAARKRMMAAVPHADVVVTNPTHLAVALQYDKEKMDAPSVVAKGAGAVAENIKKIARENDVPIIEDKPLARNLYRTVDIGNQVPLEYYQAVAELLAYVYGLKSK